VNKARVCSVVVLGIAAIFGAEGVAAEEMTAAPATFITSPANMRSWTGLYLGGNGGYGESSSVATFNPNDAAARNAICPGGKCISQPDYYTRGPLAGGQVGYNWQINPLWLVGAEADYQWANLTGQAISAFRLGNVGATNSSMVLNQTVSSFGTVRARLGVVLISPLLFYGTAGLAYGQISETLNLQSAATTSFSANNFSYNCTAGSSCFAGSSSQTQIGWTIGGGLEFALTSNLIFRSEILYVDLGTPKVTAVALNPTAGMSASSVGTSLSPLGFVVARGGMSFKF
jgi:outer membrane immunogenic protein